MSPEGLTDRPWRASPDGACSSADKCCSRWWNYNNNYYSLCCRFVSNVGCQSYRIYGLKQQVTFNISTAWRHKLLFKKLILVFLILCVWITVNLPFARVVANLPPRMRITRGGTQLTLVKVCKQCDDDTSDLQVIQCNASNVHGYAFGDGYVNVLCKSLLIGLLLWVFMTHVLVYKILQHSIAWVDEMCLLN